MMRALAFASALVTALCASALQAQPFQSFDSTGAVSQEGRDVAMPLSALAPAFEGARDRAADPRVREWVALVEEGAHAALIASAEADLAGEEPHPYASHVWCWAQWASGALFAGRIPEMPEALRPVLEPAARAFVNDRLERKEDMPALVPALIETADRNYWALIHALWAIRDMDAAEFRLPLAQALLAAYPDDFNVAMTVGWSGGPQRNEMAAWLDANPAVDVAPAGRLVRWRLQNRGWTLAERIWVSETWLEHAPGDFQALRRLGYALEDQGRQDEAAEALDRANRIYPLMSDSGVRPARVLAAAGKLDEAAARAVLHVGRDTPPERQAAETARRRVEAFRHAGEHGRAREAALAGLEAAPEDEALILGVTDALIKEDFGDEAIRLLEDFRKERPLSFVATKRLASQYLGWQRNADAAALVESYHAAGGRLDGPLFDAWRRGLDAEDRHDEAAALLSLGREEVPDQHWTLGNISWSLSQVGRYDEAFELLRDLTREEPTAWTVRRMMEFGERAGRGEEASAALDRLARSYPQDSGVWQAVAKRDGIDAWELAAGRAPRRSFPIIEAGKAISGEDHRNWREGAARMSAGLEALKAADAEPGHVRKVHAARAKLIDDAFVSGAHRSAEAMREALADLDAARALGMPEKDYWPERRRMLRRFGASVELSEAALRAVWFNPDNSTGIGELTDKDIAEHLMSGSVAFTALDRRLRRQPRNPGALKNAMQYHNKYGGSPVVSLALAERFDRWNPAQSYGDLKAEAYGDLGLSQRLFEARYSRDDSISPSDRYVGWFEKAREKALDEQPVIKEIDLEAMRVTLIRPDGLIEERGYHPVLGRLIYYRLGAAEMEIEYHPDSALKAIRIGKERWVELGYNEAPIPGLKRKVTSLRGSGRPEITFRYGAHGKPVRIAIAGRGHMNVSYDDDGEIRETEAVLDDPDEPGSKLALEVTKAFQELLSLSRLAGDAASLDFDAIPYKDPEIAALQVEVAEHDDYLGGHGARLALARKLVEKVAEHPDHRRNAEEGLLALYYDALDLPDGEAAPAERIVAGAIEAVRLYRTLLMRTRPEGVPRWVWRDWVEMRDWALAQDETVPAIAGQAAAFRAELAQEAPRLLSQAGWLRESPLSNPGFWRRHPDHEMLPQVIADQTVLSDVLVRANGDVVAGSGNGLLVLRRGFWEWFGFDRSTARFSRNADPAALDAASNVLALHEDGDHDRLWLGLRNGLARLGADYELMPQLWRAGEDGLIAGGVATLAESGSTLAAGGDGGVSFVDLGTNEISLVSEAPTARLRAAAGGFLSMERDGLWHLTATARTRLSDFQVTDAYWDGDEGWLYALQGDVLLRARWDGEGETERGFAPVPGQEAIAATAPPYALGSLPALKGERPLAVFTDQGVSLLRDGAFEHLAVPGATRPVPFRTAADRDGRVAILTDAGVAMIESGQARVVSRNRVHDLLSDPAQGVTFAAFGDRIEVVEHDDPTESHWFSDVNARRLAPMPDGSILTHDGSKVVRIEAGTGTIVELFSAAQTTPDGTRRFLVGSLLAASNGDIWAVAGASLFRWREGMEEAEEFSIYQDNPDFRPDSDMLSRVVETLDGRILLVASNEGHRNWRGDRMDGGLYEMRDGKLELVEADNVGDWFLTSYTPIDAEIAIFGTTAGFGRDRDGEFEPYDSLDDASYMALKKDRPGLYLGTDGAKLGEDLWLFGTGSGLVGYRGGVWFDPDRLNWMLPGQEYANYGARAVHAVAADPQGRVYIGTDFGLTVYDPLGAGPESFLISQGRGDFAFSAFERNRMQEVNEILLDAAMEDPKTAKLVERLRSSRKQLEKLEESVAAAPLEDTDPVTLKRLRQQALRARQRDASLLLRLERDNPQMFRLLELNPLDLQAVGRSLPDGAVVAQYLPTDRTLYINIVSNRGAEIREVAVPGEALEEVARTVHALLAAQARGVKRGFDLSAPAKPAAEAAAPDLLTERLSWLYEQLLRPVESALPEDGTLIVSPSGALSYVPFAALVRETGGERPVYAAEIMTLTTAPSLYAVERMVDAVSYMGGIHAVFGDPDGTLPAARQEAEEIAAALEPDLVELRIGEAATYDELVMSAEGARFVHLAMHGRLDPASPRNSYLLLAEGRRMQLPQIMTLPLAEADLVFLSACETGLGADGLEYRTIAHAFAHAGAPAVVATLWQVDDQATRELALAFYGAKLEGMENAEALIHAQRSLLDAGGANAAPGLWAGFTLLGKP